MKNYSKSSMNGQDPRILHKKALSLLSSKSGSPKAVRKGLELLKRLADQGYAPAQCNLGAMYEEGIGVAQDDSQAVSWYQLAADQGFAEAQYNLGLMYERGRGVSLDYGEAVKCFRAAAAQGRADAQNNLGVLYSLAGNREKAGLFFKKALIMIPGYRDAVDNLKELYPGNYGGGQILNIEMKGA